MNSNGKAVDNDINEGGGQGVGIQMNRVMESCHTFDVGFQCTYCWDKLVGEFLDGLQWLIQLAELSENFTSENLSVTKVSD